MDTVKIVEVGARDGLQNEPRILSAEIKIELIRRLIACGLTDIEAGAFVSPKWVPQMADSQDVLATLMAELNAEEGTKANTAAINLSALVPNEQGLESAMNAGVRTIAVFTAASESFNRKNINASIDESFARIAPVVRRALSAGLRVRGYISCVVMCPFEGAIAPSAVAVVAQRLSDLGCYEISLGETLGRATPRTTLAMLAEVAQKIPMHQLAGHFHDTYGMAMANIHACVEAGIRVFDASVGGLGGCRYAPGAGGNVATEEVAYYCQQQGFNTGINLSALIDTAAWIQQHIGRYSPSKVARAYRKMSS